MTKKFVSSQLTDSSDSSESSEAIEAIEAIETIESTVTESIASEFQFDPSLMGEEFNAVRIPRLPYLMAS